MPDLPPATMPDRAEEVRAFDLSKVKPPARCDTSGGQIVVCASDPRNYRLVPPAQQFSEPGLPKAEVQLSGGGSAGVSAQAQSISGFVSNRVMVGLKLPF